MGAPETFLSASFSLRRFRRLSDDEKETSGSSVEERERFCVPVLAGGDLDGLGAGGCQVFLRGPLPRILMGVRLEGCMIRFKAGMAV